MLEIFYNLLNNMVEAPNSSVRTTGVQTRKFPCLTFSEFTVHSNDMRREPVVRSTVCFPYLSTDREIMLYQAISGLQISEPINYFSMNAQTSKRIRRYGIRRIRRYGDTGTRANTICGSTDKFSFLPNCSRVGITQFVHGHYASPIRAHFKFCHPRKSDWTEDFLG